MPYPIRIHYDNSLNFTNPYLWIWYSGSDQPQEFAPSSQDSFGSVYDCIVLRPNFQFKFKEGVGLSGPWEGANRDREYIAITSATARIEPSEIWCRGDKTFVYQVAMQTPEAISASQFLTDLAFQSGSYIPQTGGLSGLGANILADGRILFGLYHPNAAQVYVVGNFNNWQRPGSLGEDSSQFFPLKLYRGYFNYPNIWLGISDVAKVGDEYKFFVQGGVPSENLRFQQTFTDPYARLLGRDLGLNNAVIIDPTAFNWTDNNWQTPNPNQLIIYELSVYGFTEGDPDIDVNNKGKFKGITERINAGYFDQLGVTALSIMPLAEVPSLQGPTSLGYDPSLYFTVERDFGDPNDLKELVDRAHSHGLTVIIDQVFNHTSNNFNPLWKIILEHPVEEKIPSEGGLYFNGSTPWGNRIATEKSDVQNMLIDSCRMLITEYHVDGFRFDATHTDYLDHGFLQRLANELQQVKPNIILIAENLPNQRDLNRQGFDGFGQWCDPFHDKLKALLREGQFQDDFYNANKLGDIFYFSKSFFASHTNNVVNYVESHDETSIAFEVGTNPALNQFATKERKGRLGLLSALVALGQPMIYMGQEFNVERDRNIVSFNWVSPLTNSDFFQWAYRLINLRKRYGALKLDGYDPATSGNFTWIIAPWLGGNQGGGQRVVGWRSRTDSSPSETLIIMLNFENRNVTVDIDLGIPGTWIKLADIDQVNDLPPFGTNSATNPGALRSLDGRFANFVLPSSSGFIYKWESRTV